MTDLHPFFALSICMAIPAVIYGVFRTYCWAWIKITGKETEKDDG